jgi:sRNA-binding protein
VVLEYASPDARRAVATLFRTSEEGDSTYVFRPKGLDVGRTYRVVFGNRAQTATVTGVQLARDGIAVRLDDALTSEMLLFDSQ